MIEEAKKGTQHGIYAYLGLTKQTMNYMKKIILVDL